MTRSKYLGNLIPRPDLPEGSIVTPAPVPRRPGESLAAWQRRVFSEPRGVVVIRRGK